MNTEICNSTINGIGAYIPDMVVRSDELMREIRSEKMGYSERLFEKATGIKERRFSSDQETYTYMALRSSLDAITDAGIHPMDIDYVVYCGIEKECPEPSLAYEIAQLVGAHKAICFDVSNACIGLLTGLSIANAFISAGSAENFLVCTAEKSSRVTFDVMRQLKGSADKNELKRLLGAFTVGDAGGAFVVSKPKSSEGTKSMVFYSDSSISNLCFYKRDGNNLTFKMDMETISNAMIDRHSRLLDRTFGNLGWGAEDINQVYCHQVGARPHKNMAKLLGQPATKLPETYSRFANITSATFAVNMALHRPKPGDKALLMGAGSGCSVCQIGMQF